MPASVSRFGDLPADLADYDDSRVVVLPVPFERTTSYGKGTARGPAAIVAASRYLELYDEELGGEPADVGIATLAPFCPTPSQPLKRALEAIRQQALPHLERGKFLLTLGGEHTLSLPLIQAARQVVGEVGVVQFDAHADLRQEYEGTPWSHACVLRRVLDLGLATLAVGVRSLSQEEATLVSKRDLAVVWGAQLGSAEELFQPLLERLPRDIYLTFDVDFFDPSLVPATGTPEPGGGTWYPTLGLLRHLFATKRVVAMDVVELAPLRGQPASDFLTAKLCYKCVGYYAASLTNRATDGTPRSFNKKSM